MITSDVSAACADAAFDAGSRIELPALQIAAGPALAVAIGALDPTELSVGGAVELVAACQRMMRWSEGMQMVALGEYARYQTWMGDDDDRDDPAGVRAKHFGAGDLEALSEFADREIACALGIAPVSAGAKLGVAQDLAERLADTRAAMLGGTLDGYRAKLIAVATRPLPTVAVAVVEAQILPRAARLPYGRLRSELERLVIAADPAAATERHERERKRRRCWVDPAPDGMAYLTAHLTADAADTVWKALDARAWAGRELAGATSEVRTIDQRRVDALVDLCAASLDRSLAGHFTVPGVEHAPAAAIARVRSIVQRRCLINVHVGADVLLGVGDSPVYLSGFGWVPAPVGRRLLGANAVLRRIVDDPVDGRPLEVSRRTYRPTAEMAEAARQRDQLCTFPTCSRPASECQLDHTRPHPQGRHGPARPGDLHGTSTGGLGSLCDAEHRLKTHGGWTVARLVDRWEWISPAGKCYVTPGPSYAPRSLAELAIADRVTGELAELAAAAADERALLAARSVDATDRPPF